MSGTDWRRMYQDKDWDGLENWWPHCEDRTQLQEFLAALMRDVPRVLVREGIEEIWVQVSAKEAPTELKRAAKILELGELAARIEGDPPTAIVEWQTERTKIAAMLSDILQNQNLTKPDIRLGKTWHAQMAVEFLKEVDKTHVVSQREAVSQDERRWIAEAIAGAAHNAFHAGAHFRAVLGKDLEHAAVRGNEHKKATSRGGKVTSQIKIKQREEIIRTMEEYHTSGHTIARAAELTYRLKKIGTSAEANRKCWYDHGPKKV